MSTPTDQRDLIDVLVHDHREVDELFTELEAGTGDPKRRRDVADAVIAELVRHAEAEEAYVYPLARRVLPDGDKLADHELSEHQEAERTMKELEDLDAADPRFDTTVAQLIRVIRHHVQDEETDLFPRLRQHCTAEELRQLGGKVEAVKKFLPTRPHPAAPDTPPWNKILGPGAGLIDRVRDAVKRRPTSADDVK
jgi:hemerythrin superfamily protein